MRRRLSLLMSVVIALMTVIPPMNTVAAQEPERIILWEESTEDMIVYLNDDGTKTAVISLGNAQSLSAESDGENEQQTLEPVDDEFGLQNITDDVVVKVNDSFEPNQEVVKILQGDKSIGMIPVLPENTQSSEDSQFTEETNGQSAGAENIPDQTDISSESEKISGEISKSVNEPASEPASESDNKPASESADTPINESEREQDDPQVGEPTGDVTNEGAAVPVAETAAINLLEEESDNLSSRLFEETRKNRTEQETAQAEETQSSGDDISIAETEPQPAMETQAQKKDNQTIIAPADELIEYTCRTSIIGDYEGVEYADLFMDGTGIEIRPIYNGIKENIIIDNYEGINEFSYILKIEGMTPKLEGCEVIFYDDEQQVVGIMPAPFMTDQAGAYSEEIQVSLEETEEGTFLITYLVSESWLTDTGRVYPVTIDPTYEYQNGGYSNIEDNYVSANDGSTNYYYSSTALRVGVNSGHNYLSFIRMVLPASLEGHIIRDANLYLYETTGNSSSAGFEMLQVTGGEWSSRTITYNTAPGLGKVCDNSPKSVNGGGWTTWNMKEFVSDWYNLFDQKANYGVCIRAVNPGEAGTYRSFASSDAGSNSVYFSITYEDTTGPEPKLTAGGHDLGSGKGYVDLSWNAVSGAELYLVGIWNGKEYQFYNVGNATSWSTKGKKIWATQAQINAGGYKLQAIGSGEELPVIPAFTYKNAGGDGGSLAYSFMIVPCNSYQQPLNLSKCITKTVVLPDRIAPNAPSAVRVSPDSYNNMNTATVSWTGITDFNTTSAGIVNNLGAGRIQYAIDNTTTWTDTTVNTASGSAAISTSALADGQHVIYIRGRDAAGNLGSHASANLYIDRTGPTIPILSVVPASWTKLSKVSLGWNGIADLRGLSKIEYCINGSTWNSTGITINPYTGYDIDILGLEDGKHKLEVRGVDTIGNTGVVGEITIYKDTTAPQVENVTVDPSSWSDSGELKLSWENVIDKGAGLESITYNIDGAGWEDTHSQESTDYYCIDISSLEDGEHTLEFRLEDLIGNKQIAKKLKFYIDTKEPQLEIISPAEGDAVSGIIEIWGSVEDISLKEWKLIATGEDGIEIEIVCDDTQVDSEILAVLNTDKFADGEVIEIKLTGEDSVGYYSEVAVAAIKIDKSAKALPIEVTIASPEKGEIITTPQKDIMYSLQSTPKESYLYIDGVFKEKTEEDAAFIFDAITYEENSRHSIAIIAKDENDILSYSSGLAKFLMLSDSFETDDKTSYSDLKKIKKGLTLDDASDSGTIISTETSLHKPIMAVRLETTQTVPDGTEIRYYISIDGGDNWENIVPFADLNLMEPSFNIMVKAELSGTGTELPILSGWQLECITEQTPYITTTRLLKSVGTFEITEEQKIVNPMEAIDVSDTYANRYLFVDGLFHDDSLNYDALTAKEYSEHTLAVLQIDQKENLYMAANPKSTVVLRENIESPELGTEEETEEETEEAAEETEIIEETDADTALVDNVIEKTITLKEDAYAVLLQTSQIGKGNFYVSTDEEEWSVITPGEYYIMQEASSDIYLKAEMNDDAILNAWHLEAVSGGQYDVTVSLTELPFNVRVSDYGKFPNPYYETTWSHNKEDVTYNIYSRTGTSLLLNRTLLAENITDRTFTDQYSENKNYEVSAVYTYAEPDNDNTHYLIRESNPVLAIKNVIAYVPNTQKADVINKQEVVAQSQYLNNLYGGNYTFSTSLSAPPQSVQLNEKLLGKSKYCANGFEPINFNTGNFFMEQLDYQGNDAGMQLQLLRTYNTQSLAENGPFGARWSTELIEHLTIYQSGEVGYTRKGGDKVYFTPQADGSYIGNDDDFLEFTETDRGYTVTYQTGERNNFTFGGLLESIDKGNGNLLTIERDENLIVTGLVTVSGKVFRIESDEKGHITKIITPANDTLTYTYDEQNNLISFTDALSNTIRYIYDEKGRMTQWYDAKDILQVDNTYDEQDRVVKQYDAIEGEYTLEYLEDCTKTTDSEGNTTEVYFDEQQRTTKLIDGMEKVTEYSYGDDGNISTVTDNLGNVTIYEYDANGNKTKEYFPDGDSLSLKYDENSNLIEETDPLGNVTKYEYDTNNNLLKTTYPDDSIIQYQYNTQGMRTALIDAMGYKTTYEYKDSYLTAKIDPMGYRTTYEYDANGNLISQVDANGSETKYEYDAAGNQTATIYADGTKTVTAYDAAGNQTSITSSDGKTVTMEYDSLGRLLESTLPNGSKVLQTYSPMGNLTTVTNANKETVTYEYDGSGNKIKETDAMGNSILYEYNDLGILIKETNSLSGTSTYEYDEVTGLLSRTVDEAGGIISYEYDANGNVTEVTGSNGGRTIFQYDSLNRIVKELLPNEAEVLYEYDKNGSLIKITDELDGITTYEYDANGNLLAEADALGGTSTYEYDATGKITKTTDANGYSTVFEYDVLGRLVKTTDAIGNETTNEYDAAGNLIKVINPNGDASTFTYDDLGNVLISTDEDGNIITQEYDLMGNVVKETDALGNETQYEYQSDGQLSKVTDALGNSAYIDYDNAGNVISVRDEEEVKNTYEYDKAGRVIKTVDEAGLITCYDYDASGNVVKENANGKVTSYEYDVSDNLVKLINALGNETTYVYNAGNQLIETIYPDGTKDTNEYDIMGRLICYTPAIGEPTTYTYDALGNILTISEGDSVTGYEYDALSRQIKQINPDQSVEEYTYNTVGDMVEEKDSLGNVTSYEYTPASLLKAITYANDTGEKLEFDANGNVITRVNQDGTQESYEYDALSRLIKAINPLGNETTYEYDKSDNLSKVIDANGNAETYEYDEKGNLITSTDPLGNIETYEYTKEGWMTSYTKADGTKAVFEYNAAGYLTKEMYGDDQIITHGYNDMGLITTVTDARGDTVYQYDEASRLISVSNPDKEVVEYTYDTLGNTTGIVYPDGSVVSYEYDDLDRLTQVTGIDGDVTSYEYDLAGQRIKTIQEDMTTTYEYDSVGNLVKQITDGIEHLEFTYVYNQGGQIISEERLEGDGLYSSSFTYDAAGQLTEFIENDYKEAYTYDNVGNMLTKQVGGVESSYTYSSTNQLLTMESVGGTVKYSYDENGNLIQKELDGIQAEYEYNSMNLLSEYRGYDGYKETYTYDGIGNLIEKEASGDSNQVLLEELVQMNSAQEYINGLTNSDKNTSDTVVTKYLHDVTAPNVEVLTENTAGVITNYEYGLERLAAYIGTTKVNYLYDGKTSVAGTLADNEFTVLRYTPFGEQLTEKISGYGYNGEYYNANTGMVNLRLRQYEPAMNSFSQKDLVSGDIENGLTQNGYKYVENDPINLEDPSGMISLKKIVSNVKVIVKVSTIASKLKKAADKITTNKAVSSALSKAKKNIVKTIHESAREAEYQAYQKNKTAITNARKKAILNNQSVKRISGGFTLTNCSSIGSTSYFENLQSGLVGAFPEIAIQQAVLSSSDLVLPFGDIVGLVISAAMIYDVAMKASQITEMAKTIEAENSTGETYSRPGVQSEGASEADANSQDDKDENEVDVDNLPEGWTKTENNGYIHIKDQNGKTRVRIDPPDNTQRMIINIYMMKMETH